MGLVLLALAGTTAAQDPLRLRLSYSVTRDSNLFRLSDAAAATLPQKGDLVQRLDLALDVDLRVRRQRFVLLVASNSSRFQRYRDLDFNGRRASAQWQWQLGPALSGDLGLEDSRSLGSFAEVRRVARTVSRDRRRYLSATYRFSPALRVATRLSRTDLTRSDDSVRLADGASGLKSAELIYESRAGNRLGLELRRTDGRFESAPPADPTAPAGLPGSTSRFAYVEQYLTAVYQPAGKITVSLALGRTQGETEEPGSASGLGGASGRLTLAWELTAKTALAATAFDDVRLVADVGGGVARARGLNLSLTWQPTARIGLRAQASAETNEFAPQPALSRLGLPARSDTLRGAELSIGYDACCGLELKLTAVTGRRRSSLSFVEYDYHSLSLSLEGELD